MHGKAAAAAVALLVCACGRQENSHGVLPDQALFRVTLGTPDEPPADWSGSVETSGGRITAFAPWHFDKDDRLDAATNSWKCATRLAAIPDPKLWWLGAKPAVPEEGADPPKPQLIPNGLYITVEKSREVRVKTAQGAFAFRPAEVRLAEPVKMLSGRAEVERVPAALNLTASDGAEDDYPSVAFDSDSNPWVAWVSYKGEKEKLLISRTDGSERKTLAEGEFFRPALVGGPKGRMYLAVSVRSGDTWAIGVLTSRDGEWGGIETISTGGPNVAVRAAVDSAGDLWVTWQGYRDGRSRILARTFAGGIWEAEIEVSRNTRNAWEPSLAADSAGSVHVVWDAYDRGNYDIYYNRIHSKKPEEPRRITSSPDFQAHASVACDKSNRVWIAWDAAGPNWGKDTGFLVTRNAGEGLYEKRKLQAIVLAGAETFRPKTPDGFLEQPQLLVDARGNVWGLLRRRYTTLHEVWSPSLKQNRLQQYSYWDCVLYSFAGSTPSKPIKLPFSWGRNDLRAGLASAPSGRMAAVWAGDRRSFAAPFPPMKNDIYTADLPGVPYGEPALELWEEARSEQAAPAEQAVPYSQVQFRQVQTKQVQSNQVQSQRRRARSTPAKKAPPKELPVGPMVHPLETEQVEHMRAQRITAGGKTLRLLRGDMHRHTDLSFDGDLDGSLWDFYRYTIDAADFDYSAVTDHNAGDDNEYLWWLTQKSNDLFHWPGRFVPLYACERSLRYPNGHRNLIWAKRGVRTLVRSKEEVAGIEGAARLYNYLRQSGGLAMPNTSATLMGTDWRDHDAEVEPLVEIYQGGRMSYEHEGAPRAPDSKDPNTQPGGYQPEGFVWNAWAKGYKMGVQASSGHASTHVSYTVLLAEELSREGILKAISARHAYAATDNIVMDFRGGEHVQGDAFSSKDRPKFTVRIEGTGDIASVDLVRNNKYVYSLKPKKTATAEFMYEDSKLAPGDSYYYESYYYVRMVQADGQMAWSSPIWIKK